MYAVVHAAPSVSMPTLPDRVQFVSQGRDLTTHIIETVDKIEIGSNARVTQAFTSAGVPVAWSGDFVNSLTIAVTVDSREYMNYPHLLEVDDQEAGRLIVALLNKERNLDAFDIADRLLLDMEQAVRVCADLTEMGLIEFHPWSDEKR